MRNLILEIRKQMTDTTQQSAVGGIVQSYIHTAEIVDARRPTVRCGILSTQLLIGSSGQHYKLRRVRKRLTNSLGEYSRQAFRLRD
jgi:hypothetical protein